MIDALFFVLIIILIFLILYLAFESYFVLIQSLKDGDPKKARRILQNWIKHVQKLDSKSANEWIFDKKHGTIAYLAYIADKMETYAKTFEDCIMDIFELYAALINDSSSSMELSGYSVDIREISLRFQYSPNTTEKVKNLAAHVNVALIEANILPEKYCPQETFIRKHFCLGCDNNATSAAQFAVEADSFREDIRATYGKPKKRITKNTVFIGSDGLYPGFSQDECNLCKFEVAAHKYDCLLDLNDLLNGFKGWNCSYEGMELASHNISNGHYYYKKD